MRLIKIIPLILIVTAGVFVGTGLLLGHRTEYCPWHHVLLTTESCAVRDRRAGMVLIEHHDIDNLFNRNNYLEIRDGSQSYAYRLPKGQLMLEGSIQLISDDHAALSLNGQRMELEPF